MPEKATKKRAQQARRAGKAPTTQAGEFVREEIEHVREGKHGAASAKQAIAIGLSKARRAGVQVPPPQKASKRTRQQAERDLAKGKRGTKRVSPKRSRATTGALKRKGKSAVSKQALAKQARTAAKRRTAAQRSAAAKKGLRTKGSRGRVAAARKAARTRARRRASSSSR